MGLIDTILGPLKEVTNGITKSVKFVEKIFGEAVELVEEVIDAIEAMIKDIENLFNASKIEKIFFHPFNSAALAAVGSVTLILDLLSDIAPTADGFKDFLIEPIDEAYKVMKKSVINLKNEGQDIIAKIEGVDYKLISTVENRFETFSIIFASFPDDFAEISSKIKNEFEVKGEKLFNVVPEFGGYVKKESMEVEQKISNNINTDVESFKNIERTMKTRFANENYSADLIPVIMFVVFFAALAIIYYVTKSLISVITIFVVLFVSFLIFLAGNFV